MPPKTRSGEDQTVGEMSKKDLLALITGALSPLKTSVDKLQVDIGRLATDVGKHSVDLTKLEEKLDETDQYSRRNCLRIFGVKETPREDTDQLVLDVAQRIKVDIDRNQIDRSHRIGKPGPNPRPIIVKFVGYSPRRAMFMAKKILKGSGITIREDLTQQRLALLRRAAESYSEENVWTYDGAIMVKVGNLRPFRVRNEKELQSHLERHPPSS